MKQSVLLLAVWAFWSTSLQGSQQFFDGIARPNRQIPSIFDETTEDQVSMGLMYDEQGNDAESVKWHWKAAKSGHPISQYTIGCRYSGGEGLPQDDVAAIKWWRLAADQGLARAQYNLGMSYRFGWVGESDSVQAVHWWLKAAEQNHVRAQYYLGLAYCQGDGVDQDYLKAYQWLFEAAKQDHANAMSRIGDLYMSGEGVAFDLQQAIVWWQLAADLGDPEAQVSIGISHQYGIGFPQDLFEAYRWFYRAAASGNEKGEALRNAVVAMLRAEDLINVKQCGMDLLNPEVTPNQIDDLRRAGTAGDVQAQCALGFSAFTGRGVEQDASESLHWYHLAAQQGHPGAQYVLAVMCGAGFGQTKDDAAAVYWYRQAAEQGDADAQHCLGIMYSMGNGVLKDDVQAVKWWRKSAEQGHPGAQNDLGVKYHKGEGVAQDDVEAVKWFRKAAEQGYLDAQFFLGCQYRMGEGVDQDDVMAYMWYQLAAVQGNEYAKKFLDSLAKEMTREQIAEAEKLSHEWVTPPILDVSLPAVREIRMGRLVKKIEIQQGDRIIDEIQIDAERWEGEEFGPVRIELPYETMSWAKNKEGKSFAAWDPIIAGGPPALVALEYVSGGSAPGSHRWVMRIFLWEDGALRELPPIAGAGEVYYFKDLNHDGSIEFVNQEGLWAHDLSPDGLPLSNSVYFFNGERYEPVTAGDTWPEIWARIDEARRSRNSSN